jgi:penicillin-binding protein 1A
MALVSIEPQTGHVRALVGGRDFSQDQTNLALGGCQQPPPGVQVVVAAACQTSQVPQGGGTGRQPGSAFKPFVLATAFAHGVLPNTVFNGPQSIDLPVGCRGSGCQLIHNAGDSESGVFTVQQATWYSVNTVYAQLILDPRVTVQQTAETAKALGITSAWYSPQVHGASYALGALDVSPLDMASAYGVFDNHGVRAPATPVLLVENPSSKVLIDNRAPAGTRVLGSAVADNVTNVLKGVITQPGATAYATGNIGRPAAGKTGTTSSYVDAWFVGYTPTLVTSVWMGKRNTEDPTKGASMYSVCSAGRHTCASPVFGGTLPAMTWADYTKQAMQGVPPTDFNQPAPLTPVADAIEAQRRPGISPGARRYPQVVGGGGPYVEAPPPPVAQPPTTTTLPPTTTTTPDVSSTTSTTARAP